MFKNISKPSTQHTQAKHYPFLSTFIPDHSTYCALAINYSPWQSLGTSSSLLIFLAQKRGAGAALGLCKELPWSCPGSFGLTKRAGVRGSALLSVV